MESFCTDAVVAEMLLLKVWAFLSLKALLKPWNSKETTLETILLRWVASISSDMRQDSTL